MRNHLFYPSLLLAAAALLTGCSGSEDFTTEVSPPQGQTEWLATANAQNDIITVMDEDIESVTRALFYGGNSRRYYTLWDAGDVVHVYKGDDEVGTMTPTSYGTLSATLTGTLTGSFVANDELGIYLPARALDYSGQTGTIYGLSSNFSFQQTTATVTEAANQILTLSDVNPSHRQAYYRYVFTDADGGGRIHPETLTIYASGGKLVKTRAADGTTTYFSDADPMTITAATEDGEYPAELFVAMLSDNDANDTFRFTVTAGSFTYVGPADNAVSYKVASDIGSLWRIARTLKKTTAASTLTIADIPSRVFTGSAYEPVLTVTDGEDALTLGTDYSVAYTDNVNAGTATATVTGLADAGSVAATKYLGTKDKTFTITQGTPVMTMDASDMTLEVGTSQTRAVTAVTIDNSAYSLSDLDIMSAPYSCTVTYSSSDTGIATVDSSTGEVSGVASGTVTITATVAATTNWTTQTATYTVKVSPRVNTSGNSGWTVTEEEENQNIYQ